MTPYMRLAWFSPLPPTRSGIAQYSRELLPLLGPQYQIDAFVDGDPRSYPPFGDRVSVHSAHDFVWMHRRKEYDLIVYQLGNAPFHDYMWAFLVRFPGMVVLHDGQVHHARARMLLQRKRVDDYRREFWFNHPAADKDLAELGAEGLLGSLTYFWPMRRLIVEASRLVVVHNAWLADEIREEEPAASLAIVEMGVPPHAPQPGARAAVRRRHGIPEDAVVFTALGRVTPEKRIREVIGALPALVAAVPDVRLLLAGDTVEHYDMTREAEALSVGDRVSIAGYIPDADMDDYLAASDVCLCMRWPTSRESSASWLRCLAAGRPTIVTDLAHMVDIPTLDMRSGAVLGSGAPVGAAIDLMDEKHSLAITLRRIAQDGSLRAELGASARELWQARYRLERMAGRYREVMTQALQSPAPDARWRAGLPAHLTSDGTDWTGRILSESGYPGPRGEGVWTHPAD